MGNLDIVRKGEPMNTKKQRSEKKIEMPGAEEVQRELASAKTMDDFFGKEGIFARLFASTLEQLLEAELTEQLQSTRQIGPQP